MDVVAFVVVVAAAAAAVATTDGEMRCDKVYGVVEAVAVGNVVGIRSISAAQQPTSTTSDFPSDSKPETAARTIYRLTVRRHQHFRFGQTTNHLGTISRRPPQPRRPDSKNRPRSFASRRHTCLKSASRPSKVTMKRTKAILFLWEEGEEDRQPRLSRPYRDLRRRQSEDRRRSCLRMCCRGWSPRTSAESSAAWEGEGVALWVAEGAVGSSLTCCGNRYCSR